MTEPISTEKNLLRPPEDRLFQDLLRRAAKGEVEVYGVVIDVQKVTFERSFEHHRPEDTEQGQAILRSMFDQWRSGNHTQPWLYAWNGAYVVADDYFWLAVVEKGQPESIAAQVLGKPLKDGLIEQVGPLSVDGVRRLLQNIRR